MKQIFYVYEIEDRNVPYITSNILPVPWIREVRRYGAGRESKREAIFRLLGQRLDERMSTSEIDEFVAQNVYNTAKWEPYLKIRSQVECEVVMAEFHPRLVYTLKIDSEIEIEARNIKLLPKRYGGEES